MGNSETLKNFYKLYFMLYLIGFWEIKMALLVIFLLSLVALIVIGISAMGIYLLVTSSFEKYAVLS